MPYIGQPIDRVDGHLKVTGRAKYAAEFAVPDVVHAVLVQSTVGSGAVLDFNLDEAKSMPGVLSIVTPQNALNLATKGGGPQTVRAPLLQDMNIAFNGQHIAIVIANTLEQADDAASRIQVKYRRDEPVTSMESVLGQAYPPKQFRNGERPPDSDARQSGRELFQRRRESRCHLRHANGTP